MRHTSSSGTSNVLIDQVTDWLMSEALGEPDIEALVEGTVARVDAAGIPIKRFHISFNILHPLYEGMSLTWRRGTGLAVAQHIRSNDGDHPDWVNSPLNHMIQRRILGLRRKLIGPEAMLDFPLLEQLKGEGGTDYYGFLIPFGAAPDDGLIGSWLTDRRRGFTDADLRALHRVQRRLAVACRMMIRGQVATNVVTTYLGGGAGRRVLSGQIQRGDGETIPAVIWYSDLRGSTAMAEALDRSTFTQVLNCYFECVGGAVMEAGGEILDFIGDAVLAIFPIDPVGGDDSLRRRNACTSALAAAHESRLRIGRTNAERVATGLPELHYGLALHIGDVMFGNIGTRERLSFSVIGPSVNQVARLEGLTKVLHKPTLVSRDFAAHCVGEWEPVGRHALQGIAEPVEVFAPKPPPVAKKDAEAEAAAGDATRAA
ncbi:MAG: adenylate/guanylate cyclase domain-containing protein [Rhodospirillaceae bacterium]|nr:adenylate/guanylate cyclase domain-containing protein [Rhodospirillaceae bacterium]